MPDIAGHTRRAGDQDLLGFDLAFDRAGELDVIAIDGAFDLGILADLHAHAAHIAFDLAVDLDVLGAFEFTRDLERLADDRCHVCSCFGWGWNWGGGDSRARRLSRLGGLLRLRWRWLRLGCLGLLGVA